MVNEDEEKRDEVLKRMLNTPSETNKNFIIRKNKKNDERKPLKSNYKK